jgi:hypothetical protein
LFAGAHLHEVLSAQVEQAERKVNAIPEPQFLNTPDETIVEHLVAEMEVEPLVMHEDRMEMDQQETQIDVTGRFEYATFPGEGPAMAPGIKVTISIPFTGDASLWEFRPNPCRLSFPAGTVKQPGANGVGFLEIVLQQTSQTSGEIFKRDLDSVLEGIRFNLGNQKTQVEAANKELPQRIWHAIGRRRERLGKHASIVQALNVPLKKRPGAPDVSPIHVKRKIVKPLPPAPGKKPEHGIRDEDYEHILSVIRHEGRSFEATPATFAVHDEEELRDIILAHLNGHYQGDAAGEAFRRSGKTDIRIEVENRAAFVAECKVWRGAKELSEAVDQLLSYLTWRDCKAALVIFNKDVAGFTSIQAKVPEVLAAHPNHLRRAECREGGEWRFVFRAAEDPDRQVAVHVFVFNLYVAR